MRAGRPRSYMCRMPVETPLAELDRDAGGTPALRNLVGLSRTELAAEMAAFGAEPFRSRRLRAPMAK